MPFFKSLVDGLNHKEFIIPGYKPTYYDQHIISIHFYHNLIFIYKGLNDEPSNLVVNNTNDKASVYKNTAIQQGKKFIKLLLTCNGEIMPKVLISNTSIRF